MTIKSRSGKYTMRVYGDGDIIVESVDHPNQSVAIFDPNEVIKLLKLHSTESDIFKMLKSRFSDTIEINKITVKCTPKK